MAVNLLDKLDGLERAFELLKDELPVRLRDDIEAKLVLVRERAVMDPGTVLIALVGATGSGKSSLVNALVGDSLARVDVLRPTTRQALAVCAPDLDARELLDWLGIERRARADGMRIPSNAVILDLPDIDSFAEEHRELARRVAERADMILWVVDPQKYADEVIHAEWVAPMARSARATATVLNQIDRLGASERDAVLAHLRRILDDEGAAESALVGVSAATGEGIASLADVIDAVARMVRATSVKAVGALERVAEQLSTAIGAPDPLPDFDARGLAEALAERIAESSGLEGLAASVGASYRHRGIIRASWMPTRWIRHLRSDPVRRAHLRPAADHPGAPVVDFTVDPAMRARTSMAVRRLGAEVGRGRPEAWSRTMEAICARLVDSVPDIADRVVNRAGLDPDPRPTWWSLSSWMQALGWIVAMTGALWLGAARIAQDALLVALPLPLRYGVPLPTWCLFGGLAATVIIALVSRIGISLGAARASARAARSFRRLLVAELLEGPVAECAAEDSRQREIMRLLLEARASAPQR
ncbi:MULTISPECIES: GTPase [Schaalia]|uniref:GTPase n=1 Tax=Schaalia TaxID=2529408 RepID=UPI002A8175AF|nr:GTPase [Schaalia hyovaginalis]MDY4492776.1 GTPase [Schaalia hyovaginalis]